jgi:hypothetical protein
MCFGRSVILYIHYIWEGQLIIESSREGKTFTLSGLRVNDGKTCRAVNLRFRLEHPNNTPSTDHRIAMDSIVLPELDRHFKRFKYTPGAYPVLDCKECEEICEHKGKEG